MLTIKFTGPKRLFDAKTYDRVVSEELNRVNDAITADLRSITATWDDEDKPAIEVKKARREGGAISASNRITQPLFLGLNYGIPPHGPITAVNYPTLVFQENYNRKTVPGSIGSGQNGYSGEWRRPVSVEMHPGVEPGRWDQAIAAKHRNDMVPIGLKGIRRGLGV